MKTVLINEYAGSYRPIKGIQITDENDNWVTGLVDGRYFQAKVYSAPSSFGVENGRVSKLCVSKGDFWEGLYTEKVLFNYDRELDFGDINDPSVRKILEAFA